MEKITFEDYPSTNTPINSTNLNDLQDNVESEINTLTEKNAITINIGSNTNFSVTNTYSPTKVSLNSLSAKVGNKLTHSDGAIVVGEGVHHIKFSGAIMMKGLATDLIGGVFKNSTSIVQDYFRANATTHFGTVSFGSYVLEVSQNDVIKLCAGAGATGTINIAWSAYLTVEVID